MMQGLELRMVTGNDWGALRAIDHASHPSPWADRVWNTIKSPDSNWHVIVVEESASQRIVAFTVYEMAAPAIQIMRLAVDASDRRRGIGRSILEKFKTKLKHPRYCKVELLIHERSIAAQQFLRACGFRCVRVIPRGAAPDDAFEFCYKLGLPPKAPAWRRQYQELPDGECTGKD